MRATPHSLISLVPQRFEDGDWSGVARFDWELRRAFPGLESLNTGWRSLLRLRWLARQRPDTIVIVGSETSLLVPARLRTIVVHHGCARTHFDRDPHWRGRRSRRLCRAQERMYFRPNRWYVALAKWTAGEFSRHYGVPEATVIPSWVEPIERIPRTPEGKRVILGDFRTVNKGRDVVRRLSGRLPDLDFQTLRCTYETRKEVYASAHGYLCLSVSEGGSFALSDAEAAALPIVTTDVGNCYEYDQGHRIAWQQRDDLEVVSTALRRALGEPRGPSFFQRWTFDRWATAWQELVEEVARSPERPALVGGGEVGTGNGGEMARERC